MIDTGGAVVELRFLALYRDHHDHAALYLRAHQTGPISSVPSAPGRTQTGRALPLALVDDRGTTVEFGPAGTVGAGLDVYLAHPGIAFDSGSITLAGRRVELRDVPRGEVRLDTSTASGSARVADYLDYLHGTTLHRLNEPAAHALELLRECGLADGGIAELFADVRHGWPGPGWTGYHATLGAGRTIMVGAVTPVIDGCQFIVLHLGLAGEYFTVDVEVAGPIALLVDDAPLGTPLLGATATDDRGNRYRCATFRSGHGALGARVTFGFERAIDPAARRVDLVLRTERARVTIPVNLT